MIVERQEVAVSCGRIKESEGVVSKDVPVLAEAELSSTAPSPGRATRIRISRVTQPHLHVYTSYTIIAAVVSGNSSIFNTNKTSTDPNLLVEGR